MRCIEHGLWRELALAGFLMLTLTACGNAWDTWLHDQHNRCYAMGGRGAFDRTELLFECFKPLPTFRIDFNVQVDRNTPGYVKLYEARYLPPR